LITNAVQVAARGWVEMTSVVAMFKLQDAISESVAQRLGASYTHLGVRRINIDEAAPSIAIEYDATRMDQRGVAALLRRLGVPIGEALIG
jgi:hypothetical protein